MLWKGIPVSVLLIRIQQGDHAALGICYEVLFPILWRIAVTRTRDADVAKDVVQDVFVALWHRRESLVPSLDLRTYLATAVINRVRNLGRHDRVVRELESSIKSQTAEVQLTGAPAPIPDLAVEQDELRSAYREVLDTLSERERIALLLRYEDDCTFEQIAQVLGSTKMGARHIVQRAQQKIYDKLLKYER